MTIRIKTRANKYGAIPITVNGIRFHSTGEAARWRELELLERAGAISNLERQVRVPLTVTRDGVAHLLGHYVADFAYVEGGRAVLEDFKGADTPMSAWKRKHVEAQTGIAVRVTGRGASRGKR